MKTEIEKKLLAKSREIFDTVHTITQLIPEDNEMLFHLRDQLIGDAALIGAKLSGAYAVKQYDIKMENAALIRKAAGELMVAYHTLRAFNFEDAGYYLIVRRQIEELRLLFVEWVSTFDQKHFITDNWGLFNPPGISHDYEQRSDELDFLDEDDDEED